MPPIRELFRLGYRPNVWALPDWKYASPEGTFSGRYDDPEGEYRVLYSCTQRLTCFVEAAQALIILSRPAPEVLAGLAEIAGPDDFPSAAHLPLSTLEQFLEKRQLGSGQVDFGAIKLADICASRWVSQLRSALLPRLSLLGVKSFDAATLLLTSPRHPTQLASRVLFESGIQVIRYPSKFGLELANCAFLNLVRVDHQAVQDVRADDPDLQHALQLHAVEIAG